MSNQEYGFRHGPTNTNTPTANSNGSSSAEIGGTSPNTGDTGADDGTKTRASADLTRNVAMKAHKAVDSVTEKAAEAERKLRESAATNEEALREAADKSALKAKELKTRARRYVNENPMTAAGIAFVAGIVTAAWMRK